MNISLFEHLALTGLFLYIKSLIKPLISEVFLQIPSSVNTDAIILSYTSQITYSLSQGVCIDTRTVIKAYL